MNITEVYIKLVEDNNERLKAFCSIVFDNVFIIHNLKIIGAPNGDVFLSMLSRKITDRCSKCGAKNHLRARFCNHCGSSLDENRAIKDHKGRTKLYEDTAHPISSVCRKIIEKAVFSAFEEEKERSKQPGYVSSYFSYYKMDVKLPIPQ